MAKETKTTAKKQAKKSVETLASSTSILENKNIVNALAYFPYFIGAVLMYFLAADKKSAMHHIKYSALMATIVVIVLFIVNPFVGKIVCLAYLGVSAFFAFKAYKGQEVKVEILDTVESKISETLKK